MNASGEARAAPGDDVFEESSREPGVARVGGDDMDRCGRCLECGDEVGIEVPLDGADRRKWSITASPWATTIIASNANVTRAGRFARGHDAGAIATARALAR